MVMCWLVCLLIYLFIYFGHCSGGSLVAYSESRPEIGVNQTEHKKKTVLVLGTGWAATSFLRDIDASAYDVQVLSPRNYFAFTPLLPSVTCGTVEARSIVEPVRNIIKKVTLSIPFRSLNMFYDLFMCVVF